MRFCTVKWHGSIGKSVQVGPSTNVVARNASKGTHFCIGNVFGEDKSPTSVNLAISSPTIPDLPPPLIRICSTQALH